MQIQFFTNFHLASAYITHFQNVYDPMSYSFVQAGLIVTATAQIFDDLSSNGNFVQFLSSSSSSCFNLTDITNICISHKSQAVFNLVLRIFTLSVASLYFYKTIKKEPTFRVSDLIIKEIPFTFLLFLFGATQSYSTQNMDTLWSHFKRFLFNS